MKEEATYFDVKIQTKLRAALNKMWDSELQLRLGKPKLALPYEKTALKFIKEIQQDSRIYATKMGFDPPKLKPKNRFKGETADIRNLTALNNLDLELNAKSLIKYNKKLASKFDQSDEIDKEKIELLDLIASELIGISDKTSLPYFQTLSVINKIKNKETNDPLNLYRDFKIQMNKIISKINKAQIQKKTVLGPSLGQKFIRSLNN